ncbi:hypothetical protein ACLOJK_010330 [Asimina triloba]
MPTITVANAVASSMRTSVVIMGNGRWRRAEASSRVVQAMASGSRRAEALQRQTARAMNDLDRLIQALPAMTTKQLGASEIDENARDGVVMVRSGFEMGDDQRRMKVESLATEEASLPRVAVVIDVGLRPRLIWDGLDTVIMMDGLDGLMGYSPSVGFTCVKLPSSSPSSTCAGGVGWRRWARDYLDLAGGSVLRGSDPPIGPRL